MSIIWDDSYLLHLPVIDAQHKQIVAALNELESAMAGDITSAEVDTLLLRLQQYTARHFAIEERHMKESNYPGLARQQAAHREFGEIFARLESDYRRGGLSQNLVIALHRELSQWVRQHVTGLDQSFGRYYRHYHQELPGDDQPNS
jgi:hemerythrin